GLAGDGLFQLEAGRAALERSTLPIVLNDHDRIAAPAPRGNQLGYVLLGLGIVAGSERWILEAALNVDHQERTLSDHAVDPISCSADADQLLVNELVGPVAAELASEPGAFRAAERQLGTVCADD